MNDAEIDRRAAQHGGDPPKKTMRGRRLGAVYTVLGAFPVAAVVALVYRFPFPFGGYMSGPGAMLYSPIAVLMYGLFGGFPLLAALGAVAGLMISPADRSDGDGHQSILLVALLIDFVAVMLLANLDKLIGPW